ncbi:unnamed protein product [Alopecurus aequalis]
MASKSNNNLLLFAIVLVTIFIAAAAAATDNSCFPGMGISSSMLRRCREYVEQQTCGVEIGDLMIFPPYFLKERCCWELANISRNCRCEALRYYLMVGTSTPEASGLKELPGCPREAQMNFVRLLVTPGQCNLATIHNIRYCLAMDRTRY